MTATVFRFVLAGLLGAWFPSGDGMDAALMVQYAALPYHFSSPDSLSLVKTMSYPLFLDFTFATGLPYAAVLTVFWAVAALLGAKLVKELGAPVWQRLAAYLFVLFTPSAFDLVLGTQLYRNAIIAPFVFICFALMGILLFRTIRKDALTAREILCPAVLLGIFFTFTYYIKEDGIWLLPCLGLALLAVLILSAVRFFRQKRGKRRSGAFARLAAAILLPVMIFIAGTGAYKAVNCHYFGVAEINTRTGGELGKFASYVYQIQSGNRTPTIWTPADAVEAAFDASPTLSAHPELKDAVMHTRWFGGDIAKNPIQGDFLTWVIRTALDDTGLWQSEKQVSDMFAQVNAELRQAFADGTLQKDSRFQISSMGGGRSREEILELGTPAALEFASAVFLQGYQPGANPETDYSSPTYCQTATLLTRTNFLPLDDENVREIADLTAAAGNRIASGIFAVYSVLNPVLLACALAGFALAVVRLARRKKNGLERPQAARNLGAALVMFVLAGVAAAYAFAIAWFSEWLWLPEPQNLEPLKYYSVGLVPLISLFCILGGVLLAGNLRQIKEKRASKT